MAVSGTAHAQDITKVIDLTLNGDMIITGNTIGLSYDKTVGVAVDIPGTQNGIGTFITMDQSLRDLGECAISSSEKCQNYCVAGDTSCKTRLQTLQNGDFNDWPMGTTEDWTLNGSAAMLDLPEGAVVQKAVLFWAASYYQKSSTSSLKIEESVEDDIGTPVTLTSETDQLSITLAPKNTKKINKSTRDPNLSFSQTWEEYYYINYTDVADLTEFISEHGNGKYSVNGIPAIQGAGWTGVNGGGWTLTVVYKSNDDYLPMRNITLFAGDRFVPENNVVDYSVTGFCAPNTGNINGKVFVSTLEGDANSTDEYIGDALLLAQNKADFDFNDCVTLQGVNNAANNFFASQINTACSGEGKEFKCELDTRGSFGDKNHTINANTGSATLTAGARQGWDITTLPLTDNTLLKSTSAVVRVATNKDSLVPILVGFQIDVNQPNFDGSSIQLNDNLPAPGKDFSTTVHLANTGSAAAVNTSLKFKLTNEIEVKPSDDVRIACTSAQNGIKTCALRVGEIGIDEVKDITIPMSVPEDAINDINEGVFIIYAEVDYQYSSCTDSELLGGGFANIADLSKEWKYVRVKPEITSSPIGNGQVEYTVTITNNGKTDATGLTLDLDFDTSKAVYVPGSLVIDGQNQNDNSTNSIFYNEFLVNNGQLAAGDSVTISFVLEADSIPTDFTVSATTDPDGSSKPNPGTTVTIETSIGNCGDGKRANNEECDDGNLSDGDGCSARCTVEQDYVCIRDNAQDKEYCDHDSDDDGLPDNYEDEVSHTEHKNPDTDGDGIKDGTEIFGDNPTDPLNPDTDGDGLCDGANTVEDVCSSGEDKNNNGKIDDGETDPNKDDSDGDGIKDGTEVNGENPTDPTNPDTDGDGLCDGANAVDGVCASGEDKNNNGKIDDGETNPNSDDSDGDGIKDGTEINGENPTDPLNPDTDNDGLCDGSKSVNGKCSSGEDKNNNGKIDDGETDPNSPDTDGDGIKDGTEVTGENPTNPLNPDTDGDGLCDGANAVSGKCGAGEDKNNNGKVDNDETDPNKADTDGDGINDKTEINGENPTDPLNPDSDGDGLCDGSQTVTGKCEAGEDKNNNGKVDDDETNPNKADTDEGGVNDGDEVLKDHTNPLLKCDDTNSCDGNGGNGGNGSVDNSVHVEDCACTTVLVERQSSHFPVLAAILALFGALFMGLKRRKENR